MQFKLKPQHVTQENIKKKHNSNWLQTPDHPYRILINLNLINSLFNLIIQQADMDFIYLYFT